MSIRKEDEKPSTTYKIKVTDTLNASSVDGIIYEFEKQVHRCEKTKYQDQC